MKIEDKILAYLAWQGEAGTEQVALAVNQALKNVYAALRRLCYLGLTERAGKTRRMTIRWKLTQGAQHEQETTQQKIRTQDDRKAVQDARRSRL